MDRHAVPAGRDEARSASARGIPRRRRRPPRRGRSPPRPNYAVASPRRWLRRRPRAPNRGSGGDRGTEAPSAACAGARPSPPGSAAASPPESGRACRRRRGTAAPRSVPRHALPPPTGRAAAPMRNPSARRCGGAAAAAHLQPDESAAGPGTRARRAPTRNQPGRSWASPYGSPPGDRARGARTLSSGALLGTTVNWLWGEEIRGGDPRSKMDLGPASGGIQRAATFGAYHTRSSSPPWPPSAHSPRNRARARVASAAWRQRAVARSQAPALAAARVTRCLTPDVRPEGGRMQILADEQPPVSRTQGGGHARRAWVFLRAAGRPGFGAGRGRRRVDDARQGLRVDPLQPAGPDHRGQCDAAASGVDLLHRGPGGSPGAAAGREQHDVRRHALAERALRLRPHPGRLSAQVEVPSGRESQRDRRVPAAT